MERYGRLSADVQELVDTYQRIPEVALLVGRFQHFHLGHYHIVEQALRIAKKLVIMVGSAQESGTFKNPFDFELRKSMILESLKHFGDRVEVCPLPDMEDREDQSSTWGKFVLHNLGMVIGTSLPDIIINGYEAERTSWYDPKDIPNTMEITIPHSKIDISATQMREMIAKGDIDSWKIYVPFHASRISFRALQEEILKIPEYQKIGGNQS